MERVEGQVKTHSYAWANDKLREGKPVSRLEFLHKGIFIFGVVGGSVPTSLLFATNIPITVGNWFFHHGEEDLKMTNTLAMRTKDGRLHFGWLATHCDQLADDWVEVDLSGEIPKPLEE